MRSRRGVLDDYGRLPVSFEPNAGQEASPAHFVSHGPGFTLALKADEAVLRLAHARERTAGGGSNAEVPRRRLPLVSRMSYALPTDGQPPVESLLKLRVVGANPIAAADGLDLLLGTANYYIGNDPKKWHIHIPTYATVRYRDVYPGVDLFYYGPKGALEYDFVLAPGANPDRIRLAFMADGNGHPPSESIEKQQDTSRSSKGGGWLRIDHDGDLVVSLDSGEVRLRKPIVYQPTGGHTEATTARQSPIATRQHVDARYVLGPGDEIGFGIASYDRARPLVIDPVLTYATYTTLNGNGAGAVGIGVDGTGSAHILGASGAGPTAQVVVLALNPQGNQLIYTTYLGPASGNGPGGIAVDPQGNAYIDGTAGSGFPTTSGAYLSTCPGVCNTPFAAKLSPAGSLEYVTYLGPSNAGAKAIAIDQFGDAYITGTTASNDLPVVNAFQPQYAGSLCTSCSNAFVQKLDPTGSQLIYSTYFSAGGLGTEVIGTGIAVDRSGSAYVVGNGTSVPLKNVLEQGVGGVFLARFTPDGTGLVYSTLLGGSGGIFSGEAKTDSAVAVAVDAAGNAYVTGDAVSADFPVTMNAFKASCTESQSEACVAPQAYVLKVDPNGASLVYSTLIGTGSSASIALDSTGNAWVAGTTSSNYYPAIQAVESSLQQNANPTSNTDAFLTRLDPNGTPTFSTFLGGSFSDEAGAAVAVDSSGNAYVAGSTGVGNDTPMDFPIVNPAPGTQTAAQVYAPSALFAAKISAAAAGPLISLSPWYTSILALRNVSSSPLAINSITTSSNLTLEGGTCGSSLPAGGGCTLIVYPVDPQTFASGTLAIASNAQGSPQTFTINKSTVGTNQFFVSPNYLEFPAQLVGTSSATRTVTLTNLYYPNPVGIVSISTPSDPTEGISGDFTQTSNCPASLAAGASCTISVQYRPSAGQDGTEFGILQIVTDTAPGNYIIHLSGVRSSESVVTPTQSVQYGTQFVGATPLPRVIALTNADVQPVTLSGLSMTGPFTQTNNCSAPLASHASCRVAISFAPTGNGYLTGELTVNYSGQAGPLTVNLVGTGATTVPEVSLSPTSLTFTPLAEGSTSAQQTITLKNIGSATLTITSLVATGDFAQTNTCGNSVPAGASCTISVTFTPATGGQRNGVITVTDNAPGGPQTVTLSGTGNGPGLTLRPSSLSFAPTTVGTTGGGSQRVTMLSTGNAMLTITTITASGDFSVNNSCPASLAAGASCSVEVLFKPTAGGTRTGLLAVTDNADDSPQSIPLTGDGTDFTVASASGSSSTQTVSAGQTATYTLALSGTSQFSGSVSLKCSGAPTQATCTVSPTALLLDGSHVQNAVVSVSTTARSLGVPRTRLRPPATRTRPISSLWWLPALVMLSGLALRSRKPLGLRPDAPGGALNPLIGMRLTAALLLLVTLAAIAMPSCGGGAGSGGNTGPTGTPAGTYVLDITATFTYGGNNLTHDIKLTLVVN